MPFLESILALGKLSKELLGVKEIFRNQAKAQREIIAGTLNAIVECLESICEYARMGDQSQLSGRCAELKIYLDNFMKLENLPDLIGASRFDLLSQLVMAVEGRQGIFIANSYARRKDEIMESIAVIERVAGSIRATANLIKAIR